MTSTRLIIKKATKSDGRARVALDGPAGSGKTFTALELAHEFAKKTGGRVLVIDTERGSAAKYAGEEYFGGTFEFDVLELMENQGPLVYCAALRMAADEGYAAVVVDSLSHAWVGRGGALEQVDSISSNSPSKNSYYAWRNVTPQHNLLVDTMLTSPFHLIVTLRVKTEYVEVQEGSKKFYQRVGLASIQRDGLEYEFDVVGDIDLQHEIRVSKTRCRKLDAAHVQMTSAKGTGYEWFAATLVAWLSDGKPADAPPEIVAQTTIGELAAKATSAADPGPAPVKVPAPKVPTFAEACSAQKARLGPTAFSFVLAALGTSESEIASNGWTLDKKTALFAALKAATPSSLDTQSTKADKLAAELTK